jgi:hypothetical protein
VLAGCARPLPEAGGAAAQFYVDRCGSCHQAYQPRSLTAEMWRIQLDAMQAKIVAAGQAPLSSEDRNALLDYLRRNAGKD